MSLALQIAKLNPTDSWNYYYKPVTNNKLIYFLLSHLLNHVDLNIDNAIERLRHEPVATVTSPRYSYYYFGNRFEQVRIGNLKNGTAAAAIIFVSVFCDFFMTADVNDPSSYVCDMLKITIRVSLHLYTRGDIGPHLYSFHEFIQIFIRNRQTFDEIDNSTGCHILKKKTPYIDLTNDLTQDLKMQQARIDMRRWLLNLLTQQCQHTITPENMSQLSVLCETQLFNEADSHEEYLHQPTLLFRIHKCFMIISSR